jgi:hypothetical protein
MEVNLEEGSVKVIRRSKKRRYVDISYTYTGSLLVIQKQDRGRRKHEHQYRVTRCDLEGRILQRIDYDTSTIHSPYRIGERIDGGICLLDRTTGNVLVLKTTGELKYQTEMSPLRQFSPHVLCDRFDNTLLYENTKSFVHLLDVEMKMIHKMKLKSTAIESICVDNENRIICLSSRSHETTLKIQIYSYLEYENCD